MARLVATGKWQDYQNLPNMRQYDRDTIEAVVRKLNSVANQRLRKLSEAGLENTASYRNIAKQYKNARFPTATGKMNRNQLLQQYSRLNWFLDNKTSTVTGAKQVVADFSKTIGATLTKQQEDDFWSIYDRLKEMSDLQTELYYLDSEQEMQEIAELITNPDFQNPSKELLDEMLGEMKRRVQSRYRAKMGLDDYITDEDILEQFSRHQKSIFEVL